MVYAAVVGRLVEREFEPAALALEGAHCGVNVNRCVVDAVRGSEFCANAE